MNAKTLESRHGRSIKRRAHISLRTARLAYLRLLPQGILHGESIFGVEELILANMSLSLLCSILSSRGLLLHVIPIHPLMAFVEVPTCHTLQASLPTKS